MSDLVGKYVFVTDCVNSDGESINAMKELAKPVSYSTMRKRVGSRVLTARARVLGYDRDLPLARDWHVSYWRSTYRGSPCFYFVWSGIEQIFCPWDGMCPAGLHGLDYYGQACDLCARKGR